MMKRPLMLLMLICPLLLPATLAAQAAEAGRGGAAAQNAQPAEPMILTQEQLAELLTPIPNPDLEPLETAVREVIQLRMQALQAVAARGEPGAIVEAFGELGYLYHAHGLWPAAIGAYRNAEALAPNDPRWSYATALAFKDANQIEEAAAAYERSLDILVQNPAALVALAEIRLEQNQPDWAKALLRLALEIAPESPAALAVMGQVALSQQRYAQAVNFLERALGQQSAATRLHYPLALAYRGLGDLDKAKHHLAQRGEVGIRPPDPVSDAIDERKTGERVMLLEGRRAFAAGRFDVAATLFQKALDAEPSSVRARVNLASATAMAGDREGAIAIYREVLELEADNSAALFNLGLLMIQDGDIENGLPLLEQAAEADPEDAEVRMQLAGALAGQGRLDQALVRAQEAVDLQNGNQSAWLLAANIEKALGRFREARQRLENAYRQMPNEGLIMHDLARLMAASPDVSQRDGEKAVALATKVANAAPTPRHLETVALAFGEAGRCEEALEAQKLAVERAGESPDVERLRAGLKLYESTPCRPPFGGS